MNSRIELILDSSALLALLLGEPGEDSVRAALDKAAIGAVNLAEVAAKLVLRGALPAKVQEMLSGLKLTVLPFDERAALENADFVPLARTHGLSLGDRACLCLSRSLGVPALTCDRRWQIEGLDVEVRFLR